MKHSRHNGFPSWIILAVFLCIGALLPGCGSDTTTNAGPGTGTITGRAFDIGNGNSLSGVSLTTSPISQSVSTDVNGNYSVANLGAGSYVVTAVKPGYKNATVPVEVIGGKVITADVPMTRDIVNNSPVVPHDPSPADLDTVYSTSITLSWICADPDGDSLQFDVYFGTDVQPTVKVISSTAATNRNVTVEVGKTYYWKIIARDSKGAETPGPVWKFTVGAKPYALDFNGTDDRVRVTGNAGLTMSTGSFTIEAWCNPRKTNDYYWVVAKGSNTGSYDFYLGISKGSFRFFARGNALPDMPADDIKSTSAITTDTWYHIAGVYDRMAGQMRLYVNGVLSASKTIISTRTIPIDDLYIGGRNTGEVFDGIITEVRLWNIARTGSEIDNAMGRRLAGTTSGLVAYWRLNEGTGTTLGDLSGHGYAGTMMNNPRWVPSTAPIQ